MTTLSVSQRCLSDQPLPWLGGLTAAEFLRDYWQKKPLLVRGAFPGLADLLEPEELLELAETDDVESRLIIENSDPAWEVREGPFHATTWRKLPDTGWTALVQAVDHYLPPLADLLDHFAFVPEWRIDDVMVSYAVPGGSVGAHFDQYDVFLIQGPGQRRWQLGEQCDANTPRLAHDQLRLLANMPVHFDEVLNPGDLLYVPPGLGHHGVAENTCLTYSVGFRAPALAQMMDCVVDRLLETQGSETLLADGGRALPDHPSSLANADIQRMQQAVLNSLNAPELFEHAIAPALSEAKYADYTPEGDPCSVDDLKAAISDGIELLRDPASRWLWLPTQQVLWRNGESVEIPADVLSFIPQLLDGRRLSSDTLKKLPESVLAWLANEISAGFWLPVDPLTSLLSDASGEA